MDEKGQTSFEYLLLIGGVILLVIIIIAITTSLSNKDISNLNSRNTAAASTFNDTIKNYQP
ncbi:Class III signal peptide [uncultured archaeon]|nr:Class III signal peptide [uncultured archaeon]